MATSIEYASKSITVNQLKAQTHILLDELRHGGELREKAEKTGINVDSLLKNSNDELIEIRSAQAGFDITGIAIFFAPLAYQITLDLWKEILLPRIKQHFGADALKEVDDIHKKEENT